jgi:hypothetical protein
MFFFGMMWFCLTFHRALKRIWPRSMRAGLSSHLPLPFLQHALQKGRKESQISKTDTSEHFLCLFIRIASTVKLLLPLRTP